MRLALPDLLHEQADQTQRNRHIALIGLRGAGKSSLGRLLAQTLSWPFVELTQRVEALAGGLAALGLHRGQPLLILARNGATPSDNELNVKAWLRAIAEAV